MKHKSIPTAGPSVTRKEIKLVTEAVTRGWYDNRNMHTNQFVDEFSDFVGAKYCLPVCNCTSALHLALMGLGIGPGDEVILPDITWVASAAPVHYVGALPVFADIDPINWCLSADSFERLITKRTKAVIVVDLYGNMPEMNKIANIAKKHGIAIIEDAAESMGSLYGGKKAGTFGDANVFSFNATKLMTSGQGGALTTNNKKIFEKAKQLSHHGMVKYTDKTTFWSVEIGYNYQWTNIQAALALAQLRRLDELVKQRRRIFSCYYNNLKNIDGIQLNSEAPNVKNTYWVVTAIVDPAYKMDKEYLMRKFSAHNIDTRPFFYPVSSMPAYKQYVKGRNMKKINPVSYRLTSHGISFPSAANLSVSDIDYVCGIFKKILQGKA